MSEQWRARFARAGFVDLTAAFPGEVRERIAGEVTAALDAHAERRDVRISGVVSGGVAIASGIGVSDEIVATAGAFLQPGELVKPERAPVGS